MDKKIISTALVSIVMASGISFYGGIKYDQQKSYNSINQNFKSFGEGANTMQREQFGQTKQGQQQSSGDQGMRQGSNNRPGGFVSGQIVSKDDSSITIKTKDGSSQIIFFSDATNIDKSVSGFKDDLTIGQQITANGKAVADGSIAAEMIQIRPSQIN